MHCQRCGEEEGTVKVRVTQPDMQVVEVVLCPMCVMVEAHSSAGFTAPAEEGLSDPDTAPPPA